MPVKGPAPTPRDTRLQRSLVGVTVTLSLLGSLLPPVAGVSLAAIATPLLAIVVALTLGGPRNSPRLVAAAVVILFLTLLWNAWNGPDPLTAYGEDKYFRLYTSTLISALAATLLYSSERLSSLGKIWVLLTTFLALATIVGGGTFSPGRSSLFESNPIWLARALSSGALFSIALSRFGRRTWLIPVPILLIALILTGSRGPTAGLVAGLLILFVRNGTRLIAALLGGAFTYSAFMLIPLLRSTRIGAFLSDSDPELGTVNRSNMWQSAYDTWRNTPSGVGIGNWSAANPSFGHDWPHDIWLEVAAELGTVPALTLILFVLLAALYAASRLGASSPVARLVLALLACETVAVTVSGDLSARTFFFFLFLVWHARYWQVTATTEDVNRPPVDASPQNRSTWT